jgi:glyoxylase-like metal-dependent hydrolase (beta-lactamase superfamily II)
MTRGSISRNITADPGRVSAVLVFGLLLVVGAAGCIDPSRFPSAQADRVGDDHIAGLDANGSMAWVIATDTGVVLIDAGWDEEAVALKEEIGDRTVHAILLTHGHFDHTAGVRQFSDTAVVAGPGEAALVRGEAAEQGWMASLSGAMAPAPFSPETLTEFGDGDVLEIDGASIRAIHTPGHTNGSAMYIYDDVLFTGDTIVGRGDEVNEIPSGTYTDYESVRDSVQKAMAHPFERIADGHVGIHEDARSQIQAFLDDA